MGEEVDLLNLGGVEGIPQRATAVRFTRHFFSYNPGELAYFLADEAAELISRGVAATPAAARLTSGPHSAPDMTSLITALQGVDDGGFTIAIDGPQRSVRTSFATVTTPASICTICNAAGLTPHGTMTVNGTAPYRFEIASATVGPTSSIGYAGAPAGGTNLADALQLTQAGGAVITPGVMTQEEPEHV